MPRLTQRMIDRGETVSGIVLPEPDAATESWGTVLLKSLALAPFAVGIVYGLLG
jgi:hypothetical protein